MYTCTYHALQHIYISVGLTHAHPNYVTRLCQLINLYADDAPREDSGKLCQAENRPRRTVSQCGIGIVSQGYMDEVSQRFYTFFCQHIQ